MKIGMVCYPSLGGSGIVATELGHQLVLRGHEVHFITYAIPFRLRLEEAGLYFHEVEINQYELFKYPDYALTLAVKMAEIAKQHQLDLFHVHYAIPHATSAFLAKQLLPTKKPAIITTLHGTDITLVGKDPAFFEIVKFSIEKSNGITAVSQSLKQETVELFGITKEISVIPNFFVPLPHVSKEEVRSKLVPHGEKLITHSSNFRPVKRIEDVVAIFFQMAQKIPARLLLLGTGPTIAQARAQVRQLGIEKQVIFQGEVRNIDPYLAASDLFLLPSAQESFGLAALEALAYGVPVVASRIGGLPELIKEGECGFLAPLGDIPTMVDAALSLLTNPTLYKKMSHSARLHAQTHFSAARIVPQYEAYYTKVLSLSN